MSSNVQQKLIIVSAPSGAGKTTLVRHLLENESRLSFSISCTTRAARINETNGKDYHFISAQDFEQKIQNHEFAEWEEVYPGTFYGTLHSEIQRIWDMGKAVIFDIDVVGGVNLKELFGNKALSIFIEAPSIDELEKRLRLRQTDSDSTIATRVEKAQKEMTYKTKFDFVLTNTELEVAKSKIVQVVATFLNA